MILLKLLAFDISTQRVTTVTMILSYMRREHWLQLQESMKEETVGKIIAIATGSTDGTVIMRNGSLMMMTTTTTTTTMMVIISYITKKTIGDDCHRTM